jgi:uncharacterized membrane protein
MLGLALRVLHIAATCTSLGGLFYARMVTLPVADSLPPAERERMLAPMIRRFAWIKWTGVGVVAVSGVGQWWVLHGGLAVPRDYALAFALKMIGALGLFTITLSLALPGAAAERMRSRRAFWAALNVACGLTILTGAALMRASR